LLLTFPRAIAT